MAQRGGKDPITIQRIWRGCPKARPKARGTTTKGFFEHKLAEPNVYDKGKVKSETEVLRMPNLHLN